MKKIKFALFLSTIILISNQVFAQESSELILRTGAYRLNSNIDKVLKNPNTTVLSGYKLLSFDKTPTENIKQTLENNGIDFLEYVPDNSYIVKVLPSSNYSFLKNKNIQGIYNLPRNLKLDYRIINWDIPAHATTEGNKVKVAVIAMNKININDHSNELNQLDVSPYEYGKDSRFAYCELSNAQIDILIKKSWIRSIELIDEPGQPESTEGRSIQKSNVINSDLSNGLSFNADGIKLLVRDDGVVGPHIDFEGRLTNLTNDFTGTHGDGVAGVMGGAGNIDPSVEGGASGADILVINYQANFQDTTLDLHLNGDVLITNSSYSNGCNAGYTSTTQTVDKHIFDHPTLMHVFSAGNSNNNDCGYGAGDQWGNITGGHKMGKNVIAVANLYNDASLVGSSSRGPAHDGRIKPDMAAHGQGQMSTDPDNEYAAFGGTSAAAPSLAGNLAQLVEVYKSLNNNSIPKSALIKAAAMNSATDLGNAGPDFRYGYGMINTGRAYEVIANNQYLFGSISQSGNNSHTVTVPAGVGQLRIMLYWHDPEGTVNTNKALVNDLDLTVNGTLQPLVLNPAPNATTLNSPAVPGVDRLNNVEQVVVDTPTAGTYNVQINGFQVPSGPQEYVLVYSFINDDVKVTYPLGGESLIPGNDEIVHWDAYGDTGSFTVEYSTNNGTSWNNIGTAPANERNISWTVPNISTADAMVRVSRGSQIDMSDEKFNIFPVPVFTIQIKDTSSVEMNWNAINNATKYYIWRLGTKYMEIIDSVTTNQYVLGGLQKGDNLWLSVSANTATIVGERANAKNYIFNPVSSCNGCISSITSFPHIESFENGIGLFCQFGNDDFDFTNWSDDTPTNSSGPQSASNGTQYMYTEASWPNNPNRTAILGSPCYDLNNAIKAQLTFDYHMFGNGMGSLEIEVSTDGGGTWSSTPIWSETGNQGIAWITDSVDFSSYIAQQVSYRFVGTTGTSARSDMAIDNLIFDVEYQFPTSIDNIDKVINYTIKPNPSDDIFNLNTTENLKEIKVLNSFGQVIKNISINNRKTLNMNLGKNAPGVYFVVLKDKSDKLHRIKVSLF